MKSIIKPLGVSLVLGCATVALAQSAGPKIDRVDVKFVGPASVSEEFVRANLRLRPGATYQPLLTQDDVHSLYATGQFYNIRVQVEQANDGGVVLTYVVQVRPRITEIRFEGNKKLSDSKLKKKVTFKVGEPLDEQKIFTDVQEIKKLYEKNGLADTQVKYVLNIEELTGHGIVIFHIEESPKVKIKDVEFFGTPSYSEKKLRHELKVRRRWAFSWLTGSGYFEQEEFDGDRDRLLDFYRQHGFLDAEIKDVKLERPTPNTMYIKYYVDEGRKYKVGDVKISGSKIFTDAEIFKGLNGIHDYEHLKSKLGVHGLPMDTGDTFTPDGLKQDTDLIEDYYGAKGYIDISEGRALRVNRVPNVETGTMDVEFILDDSEKTYVQKIEIRGNLKTKDKVLRRELAISPGDVFNMVNVKISKQRLEGLDFFDKVDTRPEPIDPPTPGEQNLVINVEEKNTGNFTVGAGVDSIESLVGYAEISQENFDLFHPPYFTGGGEKIRVRVDIGILYQNYELSFVEPWFLNRKLSLGVDLYRRELDFESPNDIYDETRTGAKISLTRALYSDFVIGSVYYNPEQVGISLNSGWYTQPYGHNPNNFNEPYNANVPQAIQEQLGDQFFNRFGGSLAYDTRNSTQLPNHGQRTMVSGEYSAGDESFYKLELTSQWFFPGFFKGHIFEVGARTGVADSLSGGDVPFYDRFYLGGLYSLRGFQYRNVAPREPNAGTANQPNEPIGGDTDWFGYMEYSIPIFEQEGGVGLRFALFYDIGAVSSGSYSYSGDYDDDWGVGLRLNIPHLGPLRLDYGIPITTDKYNSSSGQFQFSIGWSRPF
ncbi:MAG TPA: outer membrane protein assembly factor BamA [Candidatus Acidoferrales bacterium]|nr:outer membrane protein assembly factor BamA [Candidatus Acidoferrales bacterium]